MEAKQLEGSLAAWVPQQATQILPVAYGHDRAKEIIDSGTATLSTVLRTQG